MLWLLVLFAQFGVIIITAKGPDPASGALVGLIYLHVTLLIFWPRASGQFWFVVCDQFMEGWEKVRSNTEKSK